MKAYQELATTFGRIGALGDAEGVLHWDMSVMMPPGGADARAEQIAALKLSGHAMLTDDRVGDLLSEAEQAPPVDPWQAANVREMRRLWRHATAVDARLVEAISKASSRCEMIWREARPKSDFYAVSASLG